MYRIQAMEFFLFQISLLSFPFSNVPNVWWGGCILLVASVVSELSIAWAAQSTQKDCQSAFQGRGNLTPLEFDNGSPANDVETPSFRCKSLNKKKQGLIFRWGMLNFEGSMMFLWDKTVMTCFFLFLAMGAREVFFGAIFVCKFSKFRVVWRMLCWWQNVK